MQACRLHVEGPGFDSYIPPVGLFPRLRLNLSGEWFYPKLKLLIFGDSELMLCMYVTVQSFLFYYIYFLFFSAYRCAHLLNYFSARYPKCMTWLISAHGQPHNSPYTQMGCHAVGAAKGAVSHRWGIAQFNTYKSPSWRSRSWSPVYWTL